LCLFIQPVLFLSQKKTQAKLKLIQAGRRTPSGGGCSFFYTKYPQRNKLDKKGNKLRGGLQVVGVVPFFAEIPTKGTS
jgi:hypothetical protein